MASPPLSLSPYLGAWVALGAVALADVDLHVAVGRVEPAGLLSLLPLLEQLAGQPRRRVLLLERERRHRGRDLHRALVPRLVPHGGVAVGEDRPGGLRAQ